VSKRAEKLINRLDDLKALSQSKKYQLIKAEQTEAISVLTEICRLETEDIQIVFDALPKFSSKIGSQVISECWSSLKERGIDVFRSLQNPVFSNELGKRMRLTLAKKIIEIDPKTTLLIMTDVCEDMKSIKKSFPSKKDLKIINSVLSDIDFKSLLKLPMKDCLKSRGINLVTSFLFAVFNEKNSGRSKYSPSNQLDLIRWANSYPGLNDFPIELIQRIEKNVKNWDNATRQQLQREIDSYQIVFQKILKSIILTIQEPATDPGSKQESVVTSTGSANDNKQQYISDEEYKVFDEINRLANYVRNLTEQNTKNQTIIKKYQEKVESYKSKLNSAQKLYESSIQNLKYEQKKTRSLSREKETMIVENTDLKHKISELKEELTKAKKEYDNAITDHMQNIDRLSERINLEGSHKIEAFRKKLGSKLRSYDQNIRETEGMEMTPELGRAMWTQQRQLLRLLKSEGVDIGGGK